MSMPQTGALIVPAGGSASRIFAKHRTKRQRTTDARAALHRELNGMQSSFRMDWLLVQLAITGDAAAKESLFGGRSHKLYRTAFRIVKSKQDAEDAVQDGLLRALSKLASFQGRSSFSSWLTRIVINSALMIRRKGYVRFEVPLGDFPESCPGDLGTALIAKQPNPEQICASRELHALTEAEVTTLPPRLQVAFRIYLNDGSARVPGHDVEIRASALKSRILRARGKVVTALQGRLTKRDQRQAQGLEPQLRSNR